MVEWNDDEEDGFIELSPKQGPPFTQVLTEKLTWVQL